MRTKSSDGVGRTRVRRVLLLVALGAMVALAAVSAAARATSAPRPPGSAALTRPAPLAPATPAVPSVAPAVDSPICFFGACFSYVAGRQFAFASGASVQLWEARPEIDPNDIPNEHSLQELAVESVDGLQIVEIGWTVDKGLNGDLAPHLFIFHWVDGIPTCYNGCGFVHTSTAVTPGMKLPSGHLGTFQIDHVGDRWELSLDGTMFGYFPDSLWGTSVFTQPLLIQAFGEVASTSAPTCNDMGTGKFAESPASSEISGFKLLGSTTPVDITAPGFLLVTSPDWYTASDATPTSLRLGGPGSGAC